MRYGITNVNYLSERMWEVTVVVYFKVLYDHFSRWNEEKYNNNSIRIACPWKGIEPVSSLTNLKTIIPIL
jgi:hypothetical protein